MKRIGDTGEPCGTPELIGCAGHCVLSICSCTHLSVKKDCTHRIRSPSRLNSISRAISRLGFTWSNAPFTSRNSAPISCWSFQASWLFCIRHATASIALRCLRLPICPGCSIPIVSQWWAIASAAIFSTTFPRQFSKLITR